MDEGRRILVASDSGIFIRSLGDISDALGACLGAEGLILTEGDLAPAFFDLRSGLAGELFQKFTNYTTASDRSAEPRSLWRKIQRARI
jgi:hypothetical protein